VIRRESLWRSFSLLFCDNNILVPGAGEPPTNHHGKANEAARKEEYREVSRLEGSSSRGMGGVGLGF
jgi:hypothetical protein